MSISPAESTRGPHPPAPRASNPSPSPRHGTASRRGSRSSPRASAAAPGVGRDGASTDSVGFIGQSVDTPQAVVGFRISGEEDDPYAQEVSDVSECQSSGQGSLGLTVHSGGSVQADVQRLELVWSLEIDHSSDGLQGNGALMASRKNQAVNANYLLNFQYDPISRPQPRGPRTYPPRRQRKIKPYNKDLFLQANFKFVVLDTGNYQIDSMDPDKMLQWEDIICVRYCSPSEVRCPICLESPLCPQITSCGHIYCFPCILHYLLMGKEDYRGECWKKCPLCFMMISAKELTTIFVTQLQHFHIGDNVTFTLLGRSKNSLIPFLRNSPSEYSSLDEDPCNVFSKFILTSDVELSVRGAKSDLSNWLQMADLGLVDDLEKLPYVSAALEQLEERMKYWSEFRYYSSSPPLKNSSSPISSNKLKNSDNPKTSHTNSDKLSPLSDGDIITGVSGLSVSPLYINSKKGVPQKMEERRAVAVDSNEQDSYTFYQVIDGQHLILHPLNMKCLLNHFGNSDMLPPRVTGKILELETITQSEASRKRYRFLSHFSLTTTFQFCEIDLSDMLPPASLAPFMDEIKRREKQRIQTAKKEEKDRVKAEVAAAAQESAMRFEYTNFSRTQSDVMFSLDDFEALGNSAAGPSTSPPAGERKLFSDVTRLGFASAQDSPPLRAETGDTNNEITRDQGPVAASSVSFASILSSTRASADSSAEMAKPNGVGKAGKKRTKVLLSTGGGRRY
ncbi:hypothetical protein ACQJBY_043163 [Aegilops geniculata]